MTTEVLRWSEGEKAPLILVGIKTTVDQSQSRYFRWAEERRQSNLFDTVGKTARNELRLIIAL